MRGSSIIGSPDSGFAQARQLKAQTMTGDPGLLHRLGSPWAADATLTNLFI
jgi:hypothetical protein